MLPSWAGAKGSTSSIESLQGHSSDIKLITAISGYENPSPEDTLLVHFEFIICNFELIILVFFSHNANFCSLSVSLGLEPSTSSIARGLFCRKPVYHRAAGAPRSNYDLRERICIGSMTALETAVYQQVPTDEAEAQMLASADLDDMKSRKVYTHLFSIICKGVRKYLIY